MGIDWFRDLSITILGFAATIVLIFTAVLVYRVYRTVKSTRAMIRATSKIAHDTVNVLQECIKPVLPILALFQVISEGFKGFNKNVQKTN